MFLLSGQFKTNRYTSNRLSQTQQEILCESQARRLPCPEHTASSVHLLTEDSETQTADCSGGARATDQLWAWTKGRSEGGYDLYRSSDSGLHSQKAPGYRPPGLFRLSPPGPAAVRLWGTQPGEEQQDPLVQMRVPACLLIWFSFPASLCYLFLKESTEQYNLLHLNQAEAGRSLLGRVPSTVHRRAVLSAWGSPPCPPALTLPQDQTSASSAAIGSHR